jgi:hypothetical protein
MTSFSIALGGPLYEAYRRLRLVRPPIALTYRRIAAYICVTWLPLAVLSAIGGLTRSGVEVPFLTHLSVHVQFLIAMPLLVIADSVVHKWLPLAVEEFVSRGVIADRDRPRFEAVIASNLRLRNSTLAEGLVFAGSALAGVWVWEPFTAIHTTTWYSGQPGDGRLTAAGYWYVFVSLPLFRFLLFRWYFRLLIWYRFLAQVARIPLTLDALHPDRAGGLGFLKETPFILLPFFLAQTTLLAGRIGDLIWHERAQLLQFRLEIAGSIVLLVLLAYLPLTFFVHALMQARLVGSREYGLFASEYVARFRKRWIGEPSPGDLSTVLGSGDIQSLADLGNSFEVVEKMGMLPFRPHDVVRLALVLLLPLLPLGLTIVSVDQILDGLVKLIL